MADRKIPAKRHRKTGNTPSLTGFHHSPISYPECLHGEITRRVFFVATLSIRSSTNFKSCVSRWTDSNRQSYSYKESALPLCYIGISPYKTTCSIYDSSGTNSLLYFRGFSRIECLLLLNSCGLDLWKSFLQNLASRSRILFSGEMAREGFEHSNLSVASRAAKHSTVSVCVYPFSPSCQVPTIAAAAPDSQ